MALVLVVDDEAEVRETLREALERRGHRVQEASDGVEAVSRFRDGRPGLVVLDILMPRQGGLNTIREIRAVDPGVPIVCISGGGKTGQLNFLRTAATFPGVRTLKKPFRMAALCALVDECLSSPDAA